MTIDTREKLQALFKDYQLRLPAKIAELESDWQTLLANWQAPQLQVLVQKLHKLRGSAGSYGYAKMGELLMEVEQILNSSNIDYNTLVTHENINQLFALIKERGNEPTEISEHLLHGLHFNSIEVQFCREIYLLEADMNMAEDIKKQLVHYGYEIHIFTKFSTFQQAFSLKDSVISIINIQQLTEPKIEIIKNLNLRIIIAYLVFSLLRKAIY